MQWDWTYDVAGDSLLATAPYENPRDTNFASATLRRDMPPCLVIASRGQVTPEADAPP